MCAGHSGGNGTQNHLIASFRLPRCWERRENGNPLTHAPQIAGLESCALRLRSVNSERGHSQGYLGELRSRSRVDSATALLIWNGQSENRQRCSAALNPQSMISMPWQLDAHNQAGGQEMHGAEAALRKRLDEKGQGLLPAVRCMCSMRGSMRSMCPAVCAVCAAVCTVCSAVCAVCSAVCSCMYCSMYSMFSSR